MELHRIRLGADWLDVLPKKRNRWQRLAHRTNGYITPGNAVTLLGFFCVAVGLGLLLGKQYGWGLALVLFGRFCDLLDGFVADRTGTKSRFGEALDAGSDKLITLLTLIVFIAAHLAPLWIIALLALPHILMIPINAGLYFKQTQPHPSVIGKLSMAALWGCASGYILLAALHDAHGGWMVFVDCCAVLTSIAGLVTTADYMRKRLSKTS